MNSHLKQKGSEQGVEGEEAIYNARYFDDELHRSHWFTNNARKRELRWREVLRMLQPAATDRVLEVGCAAGEHTLKLAPLCREVVGIDLARAAVDRARRRAEQAGLFNASFTEGDATDLSRWRDNTFDKAAAIDFVEHVDDEALRLVLGEIRRVLMPGGRLAIFTPCATHYVEWLKAHNLVLRQLPGHIAVRSPQAYPPLLRAVGLVPGATWYSPSAYPLVSCLDQALAWLPVVGALFRFRICIVAIKPAAA